MKRSTDQIAALWNQAALSTLATAKALRESDDRRSCVSRAYYAAYQAATAVCIMHGDHVNFPAGWHNPSHEQLPVLIGNNGTLPASTRRAVRKILHELRSLREDADYRMGRTIDAGAVRIALLITSTLFERLKVEDGDN